MELYEGKKGISSAVSLIRREIITGKMKHGKGNLQRIRQFSFFFPSLVIMFSVTSTKIIYSGHEKQHPWFISHSGFLKIPFYELHSFPSLQHPQEKLRKFSQMGLFQENSLLETLNLSLFFLVTNIYQDLYVPFPKRKYIYILRKYVRSINPP